MLTHETRGVLAGAYRGQMVSLDTRRTHTVAVQNNGASLIGERVLCGRVKPENICDVHAYTAEQLAAKPTCPTCLARDPRFREV